jgi:methionyl-tRNA synthetase
MGQWFCFKCKERMIETEVLGMYMEVTRFINGLKCPKCGACYLPEGYAVEVVGKGEEEIEAKME